jgi:NAD(P)-dependent dehydrogenase (short-subunit alcohol dehydrogenase family)
MHPPVQSLLDFRDQVVLVTGAGGGIGAGIAARFGEAGATVVAHFNTSADGALAVVKRLKADGRRAVAVQADLSDAARVREVVDDVVAEFGRLDVLINNAGIYPLHSLLEMPAIAWDDVLNANLRSAFLCTQAAAKAMIAGGRGGAIVNITSIEADNPAPAHAHYSASKAALAMLTRSSASELGMHGIRVNAVAPGLIGREGIEAAWPEGVARWQASAPLQRLGTPEDVADACLFFASPAARWITGATLTVDGGVMTAQVY